MPTTGPPRSGRGVVLVIGLLAVGAVAVAFAYVYRTPPPETLHGVLQSRGFPAAKRGMALAQAGRKLLPAEERTEMDALYAEAFQTLTDGQREMLRSLVARADQAGEDDVAALSRLIRTAISGLPAERSGRLLALVEKSVALQLDAQRSAPPAGRGSMP